MNIRKKILTRCGALLTAVLVLAPTALAAEAEIPYIPQTVPAAQLAPADQRGQEDWQLLLVNPWHTVPEGYEIKLATLSNGLQVDERIYDDLDDMLSDCREAGLNPIVCSAYRTEATQTRLYRNKVARVRASGVPEDRVEAEAARWVAKPGTSEHQTGLALDIVAAGYQILDEEQEDTAEQKWLRTAGSTASSSVILRRRATSQASGTSPGTTVTWARRRQRTSTAPASAWRSI